MELSSIVCVYVYVFEQMPPKRATPPPAPKPIAMDMVYKFNKLKPPKFEGGPNPLLYEERLRKMQNVFVVMEFPERFKIQLATHQFEKEVKYWWETVKPYKGEQVLMWAKFKDLMDAKYYPKDVKWAKEQEFLRFK